ncbi:hypothetical protein J8J27_24820, partial [Mycobacterium tuberculosis]|nr:hypothetical protein [Mycobacterium tuberculosis]
LQERNQERQAENVRIVADVAKSATQGGGGAAGGGAAGGGGGAPAPGPAAERAPEPVLEPVKPAPAGLLAEILPQLVQPHRHFPDSVSWALTPRGIAVDGAQAQGTPG